MTRKVGRMAINLVSIMPSGVIFLIRHVDHVGIFFIILGLTQLALFMQFRVHEYSKM